MTTSHYIRVQRDVWVTCARVLSASHRQAPARKAMPMLMWCAHPASRPSCRQQAYSPPPPLCPPPRSNPARVAGTGAITRQPSYSTPSASQHSCASMC
eukprot:scaffold50486_cov76-Phaeocystis_antarctica.AAC.8